jgi:hypothetical protein
MRVITVARKPLSEPSVAANVLKHGTGALNIDDTRISTEESLNGGAYAKDGTDRWDGAENWRYKRQGGAGEFQQPTGRWPANMILQHRAGCRRAGTREVSKGGGDGTASHYGPDGSETVAIWHCEPGCPVAALDTQTGDLAPQGGPKQKDTGDTAWFGGGDADSTFYGDGGGASRFFKQVGGADAD